MPRATLADTPYLGYFMPNARSRNAETVEGEWGRGRRLDGQVLTTKLNRPTDAPIHILSVQAPVVFTGALRLNRLFYRERE